ncbi:MAG TPA: hypothetical protein VFV77_06990 [Gammaproteobacteria bacterium]|nr:hypothetical protein [Gammaproteobacteria bacterium]
MKILTQTLLLTCAALLPAYAAEAADTAPDFDVLKSMSVADFRATGLDHLSDAQIKALDAWFADYQRNHSGSCMPTAAAASAPSAATPATGPADAAIVAHLVGDFRGWSGGTTFTLDNGQVWQQVDDSVLTTGGIKDPRVTISRGLIDSYYLSVEGVQDTVMVKRIKP